MFALENLSREELRNHSHYHAFNIKKEKGETRLRGKRYLFDKEWNPAAGIRLLSEGTTFEPVGVAEFRIESLNLKKIYQDLSRYFVTLPLEERMTVQTSWDNIRKKLEDIPFLSDNLKKMNLSDLPVQCSENRVVIPDHLAHLNREDTIKDLEGDTFPEDLDEADFNQDLTEGLDVLIYSNIKQSRPWVGRIVQVTGQDGFRIQWYSRKKGDQNLFYASNRWDSLH